MAKKIILGVLLASVMGALVYGAVLRTAETNAETYSSVNTEVSGRGRAVESESRLAVEDSHIAEWVTIDGKIGEINELFMVVNTSEGQTVTIENRAWLLVKSTLIATAGDDVSLLGFYEGDNFEVGKITVVRSGQIIALRDENGYPLWSGKGRNW